MSITRSSFDRQYEHIGNIRHGVQTAEWRVEFDAPIDDTAEAANLQCIKQGAVVSLNADGKYVAGADKGTATNHPVPCICMKNIGDADVTTGYNGKGAGAPNKTYSAVGGIITAIPVTSGYELETTEFDASATYKPNDAVVAGTEGNLGKVTVAKVKPGSTEVTLGFVSIAPKRDYFGNKRLAFWASFIPAGITE